MSDVGRVTIETVAGPKGLVRQISGTVNVGARWCVWPATASRTRCLIAQSTISMPGSLP
jgi:hypothetical protein